MAIIAWSTSQNSLKNPLLCFCVMAVLALSLESTKIGLYRKWSAFRTYKFCRNISEILLHLL